MREPDQHRVAPPGRDVNRGGEEREREGDPDEESLLRRQQRQEGRRQQEDRRVVPCEPAFRPERRGEVLEVHRQVVGLRRAPAQRRSADHPDLGEIAAHDVAEPVVARIGPGTAGEIGQCQGRRNEERRGEPREAEQAYVVSETLAKIRPDPREAGGDRP